jgi:hypothetical protein
MLVWFSGLNPPDRVKHFSRVFQAQTGKPVDKNVKLCAQNELKLIFKSVLLFKHFLGIIPYYTTFGEAKMKPVHELTGVGPHLNDTTHLAYDSTTNGLL